MRLQHLLPYQLKQAIDQQWPLLVPTGCIEYHGPHLPLGLDTILVEELLLEVASGVRAVVAPPFWYGPATYAVAGPDRGSIDVSAARFGRHVRDVLAAFWDVGFYWIIIGVHHQQMEGPESLAIRQAAAEVIFERSTVERGHGWWGVAPLPAEDRVFERIQVWPSVLPAAAAAGVEMADHAGFYETSLLLAARPETVDLGQLGPGAPWYTSTPASKAAEATAEDGQRMWQAMVEAWVADLKALVPQRTAH